MWAIIWLALCILSGVLANRRGRSFIGFFLISFLLSPLVGFIAVLCVKDLSKEKENSLAANMMDTRTCPKCAETIKVQAQVCRYCGNEDLPPIEIPINPELTESHISAIQNITSKGIDYEKLSQEVLGRVIPIESLSLEQASSIIQKGSLL